MPIVISKKIVRRALELVGPMVDAILNVEGTTWGSKWVAVFISIPGIKLVEAVFGNRNDWRKEWGVKSSEIFIKEFNLKKEKKISFGTILAFCPKGEKYLGSAMIYKGDVMVALCGARSQANEGIANIIVDTIEMLLHLEARRRLEVGKMRM